MIVTRIAYSKKLTDSKFQTLVDIAYRLGKLRTMVRDKFGSLQGMLVNQSPEPVRSRKTGDVRLVKKDAWVVVRDAWVREKREFDSLPAVLWKATLQDEFGNIEAHRAAAQEAVKKAVRQKFANFGGNEKKKAVGLMMAKFNDETWLEDSWLRSKFRKCFHRGHTAVNNQIVLDSNGYKWFAHNGCGWLAVMSLERGKRLAIPLNIDDQHPVNGTIRLILRDGRVEVHHTLKIDTDKEREKRPVGTDEVGIDKGYTEAFVDSTGEVFADGIGKVLTEASNVRHVVGKKRNKLRSVAFGGKPEGKENPQPVKPQVLANNLGRKKWNRREARYKNQIKDRLYKATHRLFDKAGSVVCEKLSGNFFGRKSKKQVLPPSVNRKLSNWNKGQIREVLEQVSQKRGAFLTEVNPAYTSQTCSLCGCLGTRKADTFYCTNPKCRVVLQADHNGAVNVLHRKDDHEIGLYTPYRQVRVILQKRQSAIGGGTAPSRTLDVLASTETETDQGANTNHPNPPTRSPRPTVVLAGLRQLSLFDDN